MPSKSKDKFNFGEAFNELEKIANWFEKQEIDLEEGLVKFERGLELAAKLKARLKEAENKVEQIKVKFADIVEESEKEASVS
ncbi:exodeoxyribonuclease VII small subunit [Patescibacteria group bacterium]|nr:MAG: exodeoxyribonuclease VII small subunit [Patescibacteria group bacterium]